MWSWVDRLADPSEKMPPVWIETMGYTETIPVMSQVQLNMDDIQESYERNKNMQELRVSVIRPEIRSTLLF